MIQESLSDTWHSFFIDTREELDFKGTVDLHEVLNAHE